MTRETQIFDSGDAPFLQWMIEHPSGYVINTERRETSRYTFLHRSGCHHLAGLVEGQGPDGYTQREYIKVCSENAEALLDWCLQERTRSKGFSRYCKTCRPEHIDRSPINYADELPEKDGYLEGAATRVTVNAYERSSKARAACLLYYGFKCAVCGLEFDKKYGDIGHGFMHVHHLVPLSGLGSGYKMDPVKDLIPVCPNCHSMLHRKDPPYSIDELRALILN